MPYLKYFAIIVVALILNIPVNGQPTEINVYNPIQSSHRESKCELLVLHYGDYFKKFFFVVFGIGIVRFENSVCNSSNYLDGTCYTRSQCRSVSGYASGRCASNIGVCCVSKFNISI